MIPPSKIQKIVEVRVTSIQAKKAAALDRARQLLRCLPLEISAKLDLKELTTGIVITDKNKEPEKAVIQSPGDGMYCWNGSNAMTDIEKIVGLANR